MRMRNVVAAAFAVLFMACVGECFAQSTSVQTKTLWRYADAKVEVSKCLLTQAKVSCQALSSLR